jgi:dipeptidyl aminopeptidase/acylaminoacyl peptidase
LRDSNLWLKEVKSGAEHQLTTEGTAHFAYGHIHLQADDGRVRRRRAGEPEPLTGALWSPDGRYILALRHDLRNVPETLVISEYVPPEGGRALIRTERLAVAADPKYPDATLEVIKLADRTLRRTTVDPQVFNDIATYYFQLGRMWWTSDSVWFLGMKRGAREARLIRVDLETGRSTDVIVETAKTPLRVNPTVTHAPNIAVLPSGREVLWYSERDGWGHLYLYDVQTGRLKRQLTRGSWVVTDLLRVDEKSRTAYFVAVGRQPGLNVYYRHLYSVSLNGGEPRLLTPENADHTFANDAFGEEPGGSLSPDGRYVIDTFSTVQEPDKTVLRSIDGHVVAHVVDADTSALIASGWHAPEPFIVKADDGKTDLYGVMIKPRHFDPAKKYPVIEVTYPGAWARYVPIAFRDSLYGWGIENAYAFAELGAVVVSLDGRGSGFRSRAFFDAFRDEDDATGAADHVAAIRALAARRPFMDLARVGVTGHSSGGDGSLRAQLLYPSFYKVCVSREGPADFLQMPLDVATERVFGVPSDPATRDYYRRISTANLVDRLNDQNQLLLTYGGADTQVPLQQAFTLFAALQRANKSYDLIIIPDGDHWGSEEPYTMTRVLRYFAAHLGGPE